MMLTQLFSALRQHAPVIVAGVLLASAAGLYAQQSNPATPMAPKAYPNKPVHLVVTFPPGGGTDLLARKLAAQLERKWGQSWIVENRPGASGNIGARWVASAPADGYTLLMVNSSFAINPGVFDALEFDPKLDFTAVANVAYVPSVFVTAPQSDVHTMADALQLAQSAEGVHFASCGNGTPQHLAGGLLQGLGASNLLHVPYKGCGPALTDVMAGQVTLGIVTLSSASALIEAGRLRALAVTSPQRHHTLPQVPSVAQALGQQYELDQWHGVLAPAGTPVEVVEKLNNTINEIVAQTPIRTDLEALGYTLTAQPAREFQDIVWRDIDRFMALTDTMGLRAQ
ncbi:tripartite tricarboxylate transporter substrate-binding protein [Alcaligenes endophyticus]|uniref:Tripartite tricarboxylate transporter substrate binding protein n=2 Tax=Alcaligenes endophyticus TaxID=1929088 RepID=A0ABT8EIU7_9BURK|nr:tripartite tricarboxylate transporter substrate-binding protein [Alcaligenes endophyticus]MCX5592440.1 tripartite tricarboxylate transporter substrate-binding protein [Alcaligenes endophyticus]MDN4121165.1 tripartite tricarboxylate transporter substrate binding protein [Alcaligenes endophyticus]